VCNHKKSYYFHDNAPPFCPDCENYLTPDFMLKELIIRQRRKKIDKILEK